MYCLVLSTRHHPQNSKAINMRAEPFLVLECISKIKRQAVQPTSCVLHKKILLPNNSCNYSMINAQVLLLPAPCLCSQKHCGLSLVGIRCPPSHCIRFLRQERGKIRQKSLQCDKFNIPSESKNYVNPYVIPQLETSVSCYAEPLDWYYFQWLQYSICNTLLHYFIYVFY